MKRFVTIFGMALCMLMGFMATAKASTITTIGPVDNYGFLTGPDGSTWTYTAAYTAMGYDSKLAAATAEAMAKGDTETVLKNQKLHLENREKALRTELLKQTPPPAAGGSDTAMKKDEFAKLTLPEKQKFAKENPEIYASFYKEE